MKKKFKVLIICLIIILGMVGYCRYNEEIKVFFIRQAILNQSCVPKFHQYKKDFQVIADKIISMKDEILETSDYNGVIVENYVNQPLTLYNSDTYKKIPLTAQEQKSMENVVKSFVDGVDILSYIYFYDGKLIFMVKIEPMAIVYSLDGKKPTKIGYEQEEGFEDDELERYDYKVKNLGDNWYSVSGTGKAELWY